MLVSFDSECEEGDNYYIIESGTFEAYVGGERVFTYQGHGAFGELALLYNSPRQATVKVRCSLRCVADARFTV